MSRLSLLDDQPAKAASDLLHFGRYLRALERTVLERDNKAPLVVGVFGPWGCGKSTLLGMLENEFLDGTDDRGYKKWKNSIVVKFSPWMYRNEKSLLLPLLATLAKELPAFEKLIKGIVKFGPEMIKKWQPWELKLPQPACRYYPSSPVSTQKTPISTTKP